MTSASAGQLEQARVGVGTVAAARRKPPVSWNTLAIHVLLIACIAVVAFPLYFAFVISTQDIQQVVQRPPRLVPSVHALENYVEAWHKAHMGRMLFNSLVMAVTVAVGKIIISMLSAFAVVYFDFRGRMVCFWMIFVTLMLPVPVRLMSTYEVIGTLGWINTYQGLTVPLMASATATFLFRQFYLTIPNELAEAAQLDGAGPMRFLFQFLLPLSWANIAALFVVLFIFGWNQYLWPLLITGKEDMYTVVIGIKRMISGGDAYNEWNLIMATAMLALLPPALVVILMQKWFVKGLVETEK